MERRTYRLAVVLALAALAGMLAWTVITGKAPNPYGIELTLPDDTQNHMIAKPAPGQPRNLEVERSLERIDLSELEAEPAQHGSIRYKSSYGYRNIGYTRLTGRHPRDSILVTCKVHEAAPWTIWGMMYNRQTNVGTYAYDTGGTPDLCPVIPSDTNHEYHMTGSEHWPVNKYSIRWSVRSDHTATGARARALEAQHAEHEQDLLVPRDPDYER